MDILQKALVEFERKLEIVNDTHNIGFFDTDYMSVEFYMNDGCFERIDSDEIIEGMKEYYKGLIKHTKEKIEKENEKCLKSEIQ